LPGSTRSSADGRLILVRSQRELRGYDQEGLPLTPEMAIQADEGASLRADGRCFLLSTGDRVSLYDLPAFEGPEWPRADLLDLVRLYACHRLDASGVPVPLTDEEVVQIWQRLRGRHPPLFAGANEPRP
jgi:hypothetical protein